MKKCFKCEEQKLYECFYRHPQTKDGYSGKCKSCTKLDVKMHRDLNIEKIRAYDRKRGNRLPKGYQKEYRAKYPNKFKAHNMVNNAIRDGKLFPEDCEVCGENNSVHAHHDDYAKPLNVRWLCAAHHHQWHAKNGEGKNP